MKKNLWMLGMAVAALTSCTQNEVVDIPKSRVIGFDAFVDKQTRAVSDPAAQIGSKNALEQAYIMAYEGSGELFDNTRLYKNASGSFTYDTHEHWHASTTYNFAAYSDGNFPLTGTQVEYIADGINGSHLSFNNYTPSSRDLIAAIHKPVSTDGNGLTDLAGNSVYVPLTFKHMLTCIQINLINESTNVFYKINDISIDAVKTDDCTFSVDASGNESCIWNNIISNSDPDDGNNVEKEDDAYVFGGSASDEYVGPSTPYNRMLFVIPQSSDIAITIDYSVYEKNGETYNLLQPGVLTSTLKIKNGEDVMPWQNGVQYKYTASLSTTLNSIHFDVGVASWGTPTNVPL